MTKNTLAPDCTIEVHETCFGWTAAVYVSGKLRYLTDHRGTEEEALALGREWVNGVGTVKRWTRAPGEARRW